MRILCLITCLGAGGAERQLTGLARLLQLRGHQVEVCWFDRSRFYLPFLQEHGIASRMLPARSRLGRFLRLKREAARFRPNVVIAFLDGAATTACRVKKRGGRFKLIVSERNTNQALTARDSARFALYRTADAVVCNASAQAGFIREHVPELADKLHVIHNFVDLEYFRPTAGSEKGPGTPLRIVVVARTASQKNVSGFLEGVRLAREQGARLDVAWFGADTGQVEGGVHFYPPQQDIRPVYQSADALCLPSLYEGFPNVVGEALACGLPVLCSRVCDNPLLVSEGVEGLLFDPKQPGDIARALLAFCALSPDARREMGHKARLKAEQLLDEERFIGQYMDVCGKL